MEPRTSQEGDLERARALLAELPKCTCACGCLHALVGEKSKVLRRCSMCRGDVHVGEGLRDLR